MMKENALKTDLNGGSVQDVDVQTLTPNSLHEQLKNYVFASIISADNDNLNENVKQEIIRRYNEFKATGLPWSDWDHILEPVEDLKLREKYLKLLD